MSELKGDLFLPEIPLVRMVKRDKLKIILHHNKYLILKFYRIFFLQKLYYDTFKDICLKLLSDICIIENIPAFFCQTL